MRVVLQRVSQASVSIAGEVVGEIESGLVLLVGFTEGDEESHLRWMAEKILGLRVFSDQAGKMNNLSSLLSKNAINIEILHIQSTPHLTGPVILSFIPDNDDAVLDPGEWNRPQRISVRAINDADKEGTHYSRITHTINPDDIEYFLGITTAGVADGFNVSQDFFGDLSTFTMSYAVGDDEVRPLIRKRLLRVQDHYRGCGKFDAILICVPTPLRKTKDPDISYIVSSVREIVPGLRPGQLIVLESTTYPGTTEEVVRPRLEAGGLKAGVDFHLAFSPERVDPGRTDWTTKSTPKVLGGITDACTARASELYGRALDSLDVAEDARRALEARSPAEVHAISAERLSKSGLLQHPDVGDWLKQTVETVLAGV